MRTVPDLDEDRDVAGWVQLACLRDRGLVISRQEGRYVYYRLADDRVEEMLRRAEGILAGVAERVYACTRYES